MPDLLTLLKLFAAICGVLYTIKIYRDAKAKHPVFEYTQHSTPNETNWRWRKPDAELALTLTDDAHTSHIALPTEWKFFEKIFVVFGYIVMAFLVYLYIFLLMRNAGLSEYLFSLLIVFFGLALLNIGCRVNSLVLYADHLVVIERYAFVLKHTHIFQHDPKIRFDGKPQSVFELTVDHTEPEFKLFVIRPGFLFLSRRKRFILSVNRSQGSWLVAGLNDWREHAGLKQSNTEKIDKPTS